jgi:hypothetical protein
LSALVHTAVNATLLAFRTGSYIAALANQLSGTSDNTSPWTYSVPGNEAQVAKALDAFNDAEVRILYNCLKTGVNDACSAYPRLDALTLAPPVPPPSLSAARPPH